LALAGASAGAQAASYGFDDTVAFAWETASNSVVWEQTNTSFPRDDDKQRVNIGFTFVFGGVGYSQVRIISNGALHFGADQGFHKDFSSEPLPITTVENGPGPESPADRVIAPYWRDLNPATGGTVRYSLLGSAPNRRFVVSWQNVPRYPNNGRYTFQVILYENGQIKFQYGAGGTNGVGTTIGVEVDDADYTQYSFNSNRVRNGDAILFYPVPPPAPVGEWHLDETAWGVVNDSSGNGNHGTAVGGAEPQNTAPVVTGDPGTCGYGEIPDNNAATVFDAIDSGVDLDDQVGNTGSIDFWYQSNRRWGGNNGDRQLLDASFAATGTATDKYFFLTLRNDSRLRFGLEDSNDADFILDSGRNNFNAGTWVHIAVTWDLPGDRLQIYINGNLAAQRAFTTNGVLGELTTLYVGDNRGSYLVSGMTGNSANGAFDEVRVYAGVLSQAEIRADMNATHPCVTGASYLLLGHDGFGIHCLAEGVSLSARLADGSIDTGYTGTLTLDTQNGNGSWSLAAGNGVFNDAVAGDGLASYQFVSADNGTASFFLDYPGGPSSINIAATDGGISDDDSEGNLLFSPNGFVVTAAPLSNPPPASIDTRIPAQTASTPFNLYLAAYGQSPSDPTCGIIETYDGAKNLKFWSGYDDPVTGSLPVEVDGNPVAGSEAAAAAQAVAFSQGQAMVNVNYADVGRLTLAMKDDNVADPNLPNGIRGGSAPFVVRPAGFTLSAIQRSGDGFANPAAADENGAVFTAAGSPFSVTVTAVDSLGNPTPNYGQETAPETVLLSPALVAGGGSNNPPIAFTSGFGAFAGGVASGSDFSWGEVGIIRLTPSVGDGDYLGAGDVSGTQSGNVGRFTPFDFAVSLANSPQFATACGSFTYLGQAFGYATAPQVSITARNAAGATTLNYDNVWWKLADFSESYAHNGVISSGAALDASGAGHVPLTCSNCVGSVSVVFNGSLDYAAAQPETLPFDGAVDIAFAVTDADGIAYPGNPFTIAAIGFDAGSEQRSGRGYARDVYGTYA